MSVESKSSVKKPKDSTKDKYQANTRSPYRTAKDVLGWRERDMGEKWIAKLCDEYLEFAEDPKSEDWLDFINWYGIPRKTFDDWKVKYANLKEVDELVKSILGVRKQKWATHKEYNCDPKVITNTLRYYHPDWQAAWQQEADLRTKVAGETNQPIVIELPALVEEPVGAAQG